MPWRRYTWQIDPQIVKQYIHAAEMRRRLLHHPLAGGFFRQALSSKIVYSLKGTDIDTTIVDGRILYQDRRFTAAGRAVGPKADRNAAFQQLRDFGEAGSQFQIRRRAGETRRLFDCWHGKDQGRIRFAVMPRGARNCSDELVERSWRFFPSPVPPHPSWRFP